MWNKTVDICKDRNETNESSREVCIGLKEDFRARGDGYDRGTKIAQQKSSYGSLQVTADLRLFGQRSCSFHRFMRIGNVN